MDKVNIDKMFDDMSQLHVVVLGDVMLDNYWWGNVSRVSPEAPVPIVALNKRESRLGGAANVALNCVALGASVTLASVTGNDHEGHLLEDMAKQAGIDTSLLLLSSERITTTKTRVISRSQHLLRMDDEMCEELNTKDENKLLDKLLKFLQIKKPDVLIFEDYNKGLLKKNIIQRTIAHAKEVGIITTVDPKKDNFFAYKGVDVFKPNLKEVREGLNITLSDVSETELNKVHEMLREQLEHDVTFITLSEKGVYYNNGSSEVMPSHLRSVADVSGAGDTVIATASMVYALTKDAALMAQISNIAGGLVCEEVGVVPVNKEDLIKEVKELVV